MENQTAEHISRVQRQTGDRKTEMLAAFARAAPSLGDLSLENLADAIDKHEDFDNLENLCHEVVSCGALNVYFSAPSDWWHLNLTTFSSLPSSEQEELLAAVDDQIKKQRAMIAQFPQRKVTKAASDRHLGGCSSVLMKERTKAIENNKSLEAKKAEAQHAAMEIQEWFHKFFQELEDNNLNISVVLDDPWKPVRLRLAASWYTHFMEVASSESIKECEENMSAGPAGSFLKIQYMLVRESYLQWKASPQTHEANL